jgi:hypothetical protein
MERVLVGGLCVLVALAVPALPAAISAVALVTHGLLAMPLPNVPFEIPIALQVAALGLGATRVRGATE